MKTVICDFCDGTNAICMLLNIRVHNEWKNANLHEELVNKATRLYFVIAHRKGIKFFENYIHVCLIDAPVKGR